MFFENSDEYILQGTAIYELISFHELFFYNSIWSIIDVYAHVRINIIFISSTCPFYQSTWKIVKCADETITKEMRALN